MRAALALAVLLLAPAAAAADWLITPFVGTTFSGSRTIVLAAPDAGSRKFTFGGAFGVLSDNIFGLEVSATRTPRFFERDTLLNLSRSSSVSTLTGRVLAAVPQTITGYSLRPYLAGGLGVMHLASSDPRDIVSLNSNVLTLDLGGGAIGMLSDRSGLRFDLRYHRSLEPVPQAEALPGTSPRLSFWLASLGVVFRF
jgi:hypothetical protein